MVGLHSFLMILRHCFWILTTMLAAAAAAVEKMTLLIIREDDGRVIDASSLSCYVLEKHVLMKFFRTRYSKDIRKIAKEE